MREGIAELREQVFGLADSLAPQTEATPEQLEAATRLQSVAYQLGEVERCLGAPEHPRLIEGGLEAA